METIERTKKTVIEKKDKNFEQRRGKDNKGMTSAKRKKARVLREHEQRRI